MSGRWQGEELLQPISADQPCGESFEDTQLLAAFDAYRLFGQATPLDTQPIAAKDGSARPDARRDTDWGEVKSKSLEALARSKDLRLLTYLGTSLLRTDGFPAFAETLTIAAAWLETYWTQVYPLVDEDAILRRNALNCFADQWGVLDAVRRLPIVRSRQHGSFSLRDIDIATGQMQSTESGERPDEKRIDAAFADMPLEELQGLQQSVSAAVAAVKGINATMSANADTDAIPDFEPLSAQLVKMDRVVRKHLASRIPVDEAGEGEGVDSGEAGTGATVSGATGVVGAIRSRQDAIRALDAVAEFFRHNEPSSPIPMFLDRAKRLVSKSFLEVLADVAPEALVQARSAGGLGQAETPSP